MIDEYAEVTDRSAEQMSTGLPDAAETASSGGNKRRNERSTIAFPYVDLDSAVGVARAAQQEAGLVERLPTALGFTSVENGSFRLRMAATRIFGLIEVHRDKADLTDLGFRILEPSSAPQAKADAFMYVPLYREIYERHKGRPLPSDPALEADMVRLGVAPKQKDKARQIFKRSAQEAGFYDPRTGRLAWPKLGTYPGGVPDADGAVLPITKDEAVLPTAGRSRTDYMSSSELPPVFMGLVQQLAENGSTWSESEQKAWVQAVEAAFKFAWPRRREPNGSAD